MAFTFTSFQSVNLLLEQLITAWHRKDAQLSDETEFCFVDNDTYFQVTECLYVYSWFDRICGTDFQAKALKK